MWTYILKRILVAYYLVRGVPMRWKPFELAVLASLFRIENRQRIIIEGVQELLREGPNDQELLARIKAEADGLAKQLDVAGESLKSAVEANQPSQP